MSYVNNNHAFINENYNWLHVNYFRIFRRVVGLILKKINLPNFCLLYNVFTSIHYVFALWIILLWKCKFIQIFIIFSINHMYVLILWTRRFMHMYIMSLASKAIIKQMNLYSFYVGRCERQMVRTTSCPCNR